VIVLMTRWHEDDLGGYLLREGAEELGEPFVEIKLPALAEAADPLGRKGDALVAGAVLRSPALQRSAGLRRRLLVVGDVPGPPHPRGRRHVQGEWFRRKAAKPVGELHGIKWVRYWDLAATEQTAKSSDPDWTVGALLGKTPGNHFYLADIKRVACQPHKVEQLLRSTAEQDGEHVKIVIEQEPGSNAKIAVSHLIRNVLQGYDVRRREQQEQDRPRRPRVRAG
jgi:hypothetical protein